MTSAFAKYIPRAWPIQFAGTLHIKAVAGGIPGDSKVAEAWLKTKFTDHDDQIRAMVAETMAERGITAEEATKYVSDLKHLNGFKRDEQGLYIEGRQLKAALKEAVNVCIGSGKIKTGRAWGETKKGITSYFPEHVFVLEDRLHLGVTEPSRVLQSFPKNKRTNQTGIQYTEIVEDAKVDFTIATDHKFTDEEWAMIWLTGEKQGIGASRSQGFGTYEVTRWDRLP